MFREPNLSFVLGPILGGLLLNYSWQWLFIINIPISIIVLLGSLHILPEGEKTQEANFDWPGVVTLGLLVSFLAYAINQIDTTNFITSFFSLSVWPFLVLSILLLPVLLKVELKARDPLIEVDLLRSKEVKLVSTIMIGTGLIQASTVFIPSFVIVALTFTSSNASLMLLPIVMTMAIGAPIIGQLLDKFGSRNIMFTGASIMIIGLFLISTFSESFYMFIFAGVLVGVGMSTTIGSPPRYIMLVESPPEERASGQALINIITSAGQLIGGALIGAVIGSYAGDLAGYKYAFLFMAIVAIIMTILTLGLKSKKEQQKSSY